jgi:hypothetical protein
MTNADERITTALQHNAPPPRDPVFRLQMLERRERQQFRRRAVTALTSAGAVAITSALAVRAGGEAYTAGSVLLFALVLITAVVIHMPEFGRLLRPLFRLTRST